MKSKILLNIKASILILILILNLNIVHASPEDNGSSAANDKYSSYPFFTDKSDDFIKSVNHMWDIYGSVTDGTNAVYKFGNEPGYFEWMAIKIMWSDQKDYKLQLKQKIRDFAISEDGYVWSWTDNPRWPAGDSYHFDNNPKYISSVYRVLAWENSTDFLNEVDSNTTGTGDVSQGKTVREKVEMAMNYMLNVLNGKDGLMIIDNGENTGLPGAHASNYWDNFPYGYKDGYCNIYFYNSLIAMSGIEEMCGNKEKAKYYNEIAEKVKETYNKTFWDNEKKRYIGTIDINGGIWDFGFTFQNIEALAYGLGDKAKAKHIYDWLDGKRIIDGDTSTGKDIYNRFKIAPRSTTVAIESKGKPYWWNGFGAILPNSNAKFGQHLENGGAIFYTSFYDLMARVKYLGANNAKARFDVIVEEFKKDELRRDPINPVGAPWVIGVIGEFPESGLVPTAFLYGFLGIDATKDGLQIAPNLPDDLKQAGVKNIVYGGVKYDITVTKNSIQIETKEGGVGNIRCTFSNLRPNEKYMITSRDVLNGGENITYVTADKHGTVNTELDMTGNKVVIIRWDGRSALIVNIFVALLGVALACGLGFAIVIHMRSKRKKVL